MFALELIKKAFLACHKLDINPVCVLLTLIQKHDSCLKSVFLCVFTAYSIQGQSVQIISPSSESHQQVVAVGQPLTTQPQNTVVVKAPLHTQLCGTEGYTWHFKLEFVQLFSKTSAYMHFVFKINKTENNQKQLLRQNCTKAVPPDVPPCM